MTLFFLKKSTTNLLFSETERCRECSGIDRDRFLQVNDPPVLFFELLCASANRSGLHLLEPFQQKAVKWITGNKSAVYISQIQLLNILSLNEFANHSRSVTGQSSCRETRHFDNQGVGKEMFKLP